MRNFRTMLISALAGATVVRIVHTRGVRVCRLAQGAGRRRSRALEQTACMFRRVPVCTARGMGVNHYVGTLRTVWNDAPPWRP